MEGSNTLFFSSKFPWVGQIISLKFIEILGLSPLKVLLDLVSALTASVLNVPTEPS